jgi:hypothetical protein
VSIAPPFGGVDPLLGPQTDKEKEMRAIKRAASSLGQLFVRAFKEKGIEGDIVIVEDTTRPPPLCRCGLGAIMSRIRYKKSLKPFVVKGRIYTGGELLAQYLVCKTCDLITEIKINKSVFPETLPNIPGPQDPL